MPSSFRDTSRWAKKGSGAVPFETIVKRKRRPSVSTTRHPVPKGSHHHHQYHDHHDRRRRRSSPELIAISISIVSFVRKVYISFISFNRFSFFFSTFFFCIPVNGYRFREFGQIHKKKRICVMIVACRETPFFPSCSCRRICVINRPH